MQGLEVLLIGDRKAQLVYAEGNGLTTVRDLYYGTITFFGATMWDIVDEGVNVNEINARTKVQLWKD